MTSPLPSRRGILLGGLGVAATATLAACTGGGGTTVHCHNIYHAEAGMMIALNYAT